MLNIIGVAVGSGGPDPRAAEGPLKMRQSIYLNHLIDSGSSIKWDEILHEKPHKTKLATLCELFNRLSVKIKQYTQDKKRFCVIGGDHSAAIGTWGGAATALNAPLGLIWIDAHIDAHTHETTPSGNVHGMPVAVLLGYGDKNLTHLSHNAPKILPENLCLIGVRSFEPSEQALLEKLNVKIYDIEAVKQRGMSAILQEAKEHVSKNTVGYGITIDIDAMDPKDVPAVSTPEPNGICADDLLKALKEISSDPKQIGYEIMEFNPSQDIEQKSEKFIVELIKIMAGEKNE